MNFPNLLYRVRSNCMEHDGEKCCGCWMWIGGYRADGRYGQLKVGGKPINVHRAAYMAANHKECIDLVLDISHICHNKMCVNLKHLSREEHLVNMDRESCLWLGHCTSHQCADGKPYKSCVCLNIVKESEFR